VSPGRSSGIALDGVLRIAEGLDVVLIGENEALIQNGSRSEPSELLRDADLTGVLRRLLGALRDGSLRRADLLARFTERDRPEAEQLLDALIDRGIVSDANHSPVDQYLAYTFEGQSGLDWARVTVLGAGPLGARIAHALNRHGVGELRVLDDRPADALWAEFLPLLPGPLPHANGRADQALPAALNHAGKASVAALDGATDAAGVAAAVAGADFAILATEQPNPRLAHLVNRACIREGRAWLAAGIDGHLGLVGPLFMPPDSACYNEYETLLRSTSANQAMDRLYHRFLLGRGTGSFFPGLPGYADVVAGLASVAAVQHLVRGRSFALARLTTIDFETMRFSVDNVLKLPRCPVCGGSPNPREPPFAEGERPDLEA
jgi:bacteriocin biosynthesis cyclodehydratase domain-containing protein